MFLARSPSPGYRTGVSFHSRAVCKLVRDFAGDKSLHLVGIPGHRRMQISVSPRTHERVHPIGHRGLGFAPLFSVSPVIGWRTGSTSTSLHTVLSRSASRSRSTLCRCITKPPLLHIIAWSISNISPHTHVFGRSVISQLYLTLMASLNSRLLRS